MPKVPRLLPVHRAPADTGRPDLRVSRRVRIPVIIAEHAELSDRHREIAAEHIRRAAQAVLREIGRAEIIHAEAHRGEIRLRLRVERFRLVKGACRIVRCGVLETAEACPERSLLSQRRIELRSVESAPREPRGLRAHVDFIPAEHERRAAEIMAHIDAVRFSHRRRCSF